MSKTISSRIDDTLHTLITLSLSSFCPRTVLRMSSRISITKTGHNAVYDHFLYRKNKKNIEKRIIANINS
jgi:hypothetical protein